MSIPILVMRREGGKHRGRDREFLPAALEILERPASPIALALLWTICALAVFGLLLAHFGRVEIIASAQGKIRPQGQVKTLQSMENGKTSEINVRDGQHVSRGEVLVALDSREIRAELASSAGSLAAARAEIERRIMTDRVVAVHADSAYQAPALTLPADIAGVLLAREQRNAEGDLTALNATIENLRAQVRQKTADLERVRGSVAAQTTLVETLSERVAMKTTLYTNHTGSKAALIDATETLQTQQASLVTQTGQLGSIGGEISVVQSQIAQTIEQFRADNLRKLAERERQADELEHKVSELSARLENFTLRSPIDGIVQGVAVTTVGQVVTISQEVARVVPDLARLEVEAYVQNKDIGFLTIDQEAAIKIETLPFSRYGTVSATVTHIASDAMPLPDAQAAEGGQPRMMRSTGVAAGEQRVQNLVYPITLRLNQQTVDADGRAVRLMSGMAVTAEIKTGSRSVLEYILSPLVEVSASALHER